jgi:hypothetical protein
MGWYPRDNVFKFLKTQFLRIPILWCSGGGGAGPGLTASGRAPHGARITPCAWNKVSLKKYPIELRFLIEFINF